MTADVVERRALRVSGVVQGVGFRPFVHRLARELGLAGFVSNDAAGVVVEAEGPTGAIAELVRRVRADAPPLARVDAVTTAAVPLVGDTSFVIRDSVPGDGPRTLIPPDVAVCDDCLAEMADPADRRARYPFTNCTNCGPRYTIIRGLPYDRPATTMAGFAMCAACAAEYADPADRRYHAQPVACPVCGPRLRLEAGDGTVRGTDPCLAAAHELLTAGRVVAIKGLGGFHLAVDAGDEDAVALLRRRKGRVDKPFAVMVADVDGARMLADLDDREVDALRSAARPIVLVRRRAGAALAAGVAPSNPLVGVMLPYTPLHHLLFAPVPGSAAPVPRVLVMTSGNLADEPICVDDDEARTRLAGLADAFLLHDRPIHVPCDDSVVRVVDGATQPVRRSRGYAPLPVDLPVAVRPTLAVGGELKNTFCLADAGRAWVGAHVGDMENLETLAAFERAVEGFERMYGVTPELVAVDGHPGYLTRQWALERFPAERVVQVQHHHAHVAAAMAEHGLDGSTPVIGVAFDGTGYGRADDGTVQAWGGEVLLADYRGFRRAGHLRPLPLPGGDAGVEAPCRVAVAALVACGVPLDDDVPSVRACSEVERAVVARQVERRVGVVPTTSMGRLFDTVSSLLGVRHRVTYEAQAAMELEASAASGRPGAVRLDLPVDDDGVIDPEPALRRLLAEARRGRSTADLARAFHEAVADAVVAAAEVACRAGGRSPVVLTGGVFQNALLTVATRRRLEGAGFEVLTHRLVPANDGGLALGQALVAGTRRR